MGDNNNVNVISVQKLNNDNDNVRGKQFSKSKEVEFVAEQLVDKLKSKESYKFYCQVAYKLPEHKIWANLETALNGKNPGGLFNWLCRRDMTNG